MNNNSENNITLSEEEKEVFEKTLNEFRSFLQPYKINKFTAVDEKCNLLDDEDEESFLEKNEQWILLGVSVVISAMKGITLTQEDLRKLIYNPRDFFKWRGQSSTFITSLIEEAGEYALTKFGGAKGAGVAGKWSALQTYSALLDVYDIFFPTGDHLSIVMDQGGINKLIQASMIAKQSAKNNPETLECLSTAVKTKYPTLSETEINKILSTMRAVYLKTKYMPWIVNWNRKYEASGTVPSSNEDVKICTPNVGSTTGEYRLGPPTNNCDPIYIESYDTFKENNKIIYRDKFSGFINLETAKEIYNRLKTTYNKTVTSEQISSALGTIFISVNIRTITKEQFINAVVAYIVTGTIPKFQSVMKSTATTINPLYNRKYYILYLISLLLISIYIFFLFFYVIYIVL